MIFTSEDDGLHWKTACRHAAAAVKGVLGDWSDDSASAQIVGGYAQGLGGALSGEFIYNERGDPLAVTFVDYLLPAAHETPTPDVLLTEDYTTPRSPLGIKGAGESGITGVGAAIASAIDDAISIQGAVTRLPVTPQRLNQPLAKRWACVLVKCRWMSRSARYRAMPDVR
jgi:hypothetical protein